MIAASKEKISRDNTRSHSAKFDRAKECIIVESSLVTHSLKSADELIVCISFHVMITHLNSGTVDKRDKPPSHRVCPSKLTKQELEDLYFVLMDTNLDLKKTVNTQQDNIKHLNTKVHRLLTAQKGTMKDKCCPDTKAVVSEQRDIISDLKKANDRMSDRIRILNMRLCSAKQFLKSNQSLSSSRCAKCCVAPPASLKNSSVSVLHSKKSEHKPAESISRDGEKQFVVRNYASTKTAETETSEPEKDCPDSVCNENKCKTQMEELKQKIIDLQEESSRYHCEYSTRITRLEMEMSELHAENARMRTERASTLHSLDVKAEREIQLAAKLRAADARCNEMSSQLLLQNNKMSELDARVRAASRALERRQSLAFVGSQSKIGDATVKGMDSPQRRRSLADAQSKTGDTVPNGMELPRRRSLVTPESQSTKSGSGVALHDIDALPSTSASVIMQDKNRKNDVIMTKETENQPTDHHIQPKNDCIDRDGERHQSISFGDPQSTQQRRSEQTGEKRQSISFLLDPNAQPKSNEIVSQNEDRRTSIHLDPNTKRSNDDVLSPIDERKLSVHCGVTPRLSGDRLVKDAERHHPIAIRDPILERTLSSGENLKLQESETGNKSQNCGEAPEPPRSVTRCPSYVILGNSRSPAKSKNSDDSGYNDNPTGEEERVLAKINAELVKKIKDLQDKLDVLRIASAGLKAEQMSRATETKKADVEPKMEDSVRNDRVFTKEPIPARDYKEAYTTVPSTMKEEAPVTIKEESASVTTKEETAAGEMERKKEIPEQSGTESSPIDRANQLWAQYSGRELPQKEDKIQFSNLYRQFNSVDKIMPTSSETDPDKDSTTSSKSFRKRRLERKRFLEDKNVDTQNELVDKIEMDEDLARTKDRRDSRHDFPFYEYKPTKSQLFIQDDKIRHDVIAADDLKQDLNMPAEVKSGMKIHDNDAFRHDVIKPTDDFKQDLLQSDKIGVKIQDNDVHKPGVEKRASDRFRARESVIDQAARQRISEVRDMQDKKDKEQTTQTRRMSDSSPSDAPLQVKCVANDACPRTASPDNTDHEISHLSDLPPEHDVSCKSPRNLISPGEQKTTTTCTDSSTEPTSDMPTMSEGEVPCSGGDRRCSIGEMKDEAVETKAYKEAASVSQMMEQALQSISEELARCRELLQNTTAREIAPETRETSTTCPSRVALKHSAATPQLVQPSSAPCKCTFTLHIGTLVLSDEAVVYSRDKSLLLTWKFYDQNVTLTRVRGGRVILFDFTTEYDAVLDERFTDYLKYEEMPIVICELEKQNFPFATCALPFRDVLLNPNHRVDMSLALTVGPDMRKADAPLSMDSLVTSDEVGVLDLWCMLRNKTSFSEPSKAMPRDSCNPMLDIRSEEFGMSDEASKFPQAMKPVAATPQLLDDSSLNKYEAHNSRLSSIIAHEVPTKIKRRGEMEKAIDEKRSLALSNESIKGLERMEDDVLCHQPHQSVSSWARFLRRQSRFQTDNKKQRKGRNSSELLETMRSTCKPHAKMSKRASFETEEPVNDQGDDKESQQKKAVTMNVPYSLLGWEQPQNELEQVPLHSKESIVITILWLALNEECGAMSDSSVQRLYVAFSLLGRGGAELETPVSLPKPRSYVDKCIFNFRKSIQLRQCDLPQLGHMGRCKNNESHRHNPKDCIVFTVISEPAEDPLGLASCEDIGYAYLYLGDVLAASDAETYVEVVPVRAARRNDVVCGVLCVQVDGLDLVRKAKLVNLSQ